MTQFHVIVYITKPELKLSVSWTALYDRDKALMVVVISIKKM